MRKVLLISILLAVSGGLLFSPSLACASDQWPMYQANASHTDFIPVSLDPAKFTLRWQKKLGSLELHPVIAAGGRVFVTQISSSVSQSLYALESKSGDLEWSEVLSGAYFAGAPGYNDGLIFVHAYEGAQAYDDRGSFLRAYGAESGNLVFKSRHSNSSSRYQLPSIYGGSVYIDGDGILTGTYALDAKNGQQEWYHNQSVNNQCTPAIDEKWVYVYSDGLNVIDRLSGRTVFSIADPGFAGSSGKTAPVLGGSSDVLMSIGGRLIRFDVDTREIGWVNSADFSGEPTVVNGVVYALSSGILGAYDQSTGASLWTWEAPGASSLRDTIIATNSHLFV